MKATGQIARMAMAPLLVGVFACVATTTTHLNANELESSNKLTEFLLQDGIYWPKLKQDEPPIVQARNQSSSTPTTSRRSRRHNHQHAAHHHHNNQGNQLNYKTTYACEGNQMELNCQEGKLIHLVRAIYGRFSLTICNELGHSNYSVQCASFRAFLLMENRCNKLSNCAVTVSKELFGDPCEGTSKYLEVQYFCDDANTQVNGTTGAAHNKHSGSSVISNPNNRTAAPSNGHKSPTESQDSSSMDQQASATMTRTTSGHNSPADLDSQTSTSSVPVIPSVQQQTQQLFCPPQISSRNLYWNATRAGQVARQTCPDGASGRVAWTCDFERLRFAPSLGPDFSQCKSNWLARLSLQLDQLLETPLVSNSGSSREIIQNQDEQMIKSILGELSLMANSKELFSEDLKRIDVMLSQMINQLRSLAVLFGGAGSSGSIAPQSPRDDNQPWATPLQQLRNPLIVRMHQELFQKLVTISSSLFDLSQRNAWLELPNADARRRLETRLLSHLKEAGLMLAQSLPVDQLAEMAPVRRVNIYAGISVLSTSSSASVSIDGSTGELNLQSGKSSLAYLNRLFGATSDQDEQQQQQQPQIATEWRLQATLLKELASNGINKFLLLDIKKPDFSLIRQQLEVQQQQQVSEQLATNNNNNNNNFLVADNTNQAFNLAGDQTQYQSRIFGIFPVIGDTGELAVELDNKPELSRLAESLSKWPISVEFKLSSPPGASQSSMTSSTSAPTGAYLANQRHCQSLSDNSNSAPTMDFSSSPTNRCHLSRYNATNFICSCDKFGFLLLGQQFLAAAATGPVNPMLQNDAWPSSPTYDSDTLLDNTRTYDSYVVNKNQQQPQQQQSIGILAGIMIVLGVALLILTVGGLLVSVAFRLSNGSGSTQANKKQSYFDGTTTTTGPLTDHNLMGSDPLVSNASTTHSASIIGLNGAGQYTGSNAPSVGYKPHQLYSHQQAPPMMEAYASGARSHAWPLRALHWLLARPVEWLSDQLTGSDRQDNVHHFPPMGKSSTAAVDHMSIQHRLIGAAATSTTTPAVGTLGYHHQHQKAANQYQNGYTTALHQRAAIGSTGSQSAVPLNGASSNSSYVSSSAYYEEIGPGALTKVSTSHTIVDPFKRHLHEQQQQQFQHWQAAPQQQHHNTHTISYSMMEPTNQQQQQQISLITKQHLHTDLSPLQSSSSTSSANSTHQQHQQHAATTTPRHYLFASPSAVSAYKQQQQQQFRTNTNGFHHAGEQ